MNVSISDWLFHRKKIVPSKEVNDLLHPRVYTYIEIGSNYQSSIRSKKSSLLVDYRIVTPVIVAFDVSFVFRLRFTLALLHLSRRRFILSCEYVPLTMWCVLSFAFIYYALRTLGVCTYLVDRNLSCMFDFLNDITKVVCTILRIDILESARLFHAGNSVHAYAKPGDPGATRRIA